MAQGTLLPSTPLPSKSGFCTKESGNSSSGRNSSGSSGVDPSKVSTSSNSGGGGHSSSSTNSRLQGVAACKLDLGQLSKHLESAKAQRKRLFKSASAGASPITTPLAGRITGASPFVSAMPAFDEKNNARHLGKGNCGKVCHLSQVFLVGMVLVLIFSLVFVALFAPYLARVNEPLVLMMNSAGQRIALKLHPHSQSDEFLSASDLRNPRLASRKELVKIFHSSEESSGETEVQDGPGRGGLLKLIQIDNFRR